MKRNKKQRTKLVLLVLILCITLAYAALRTGLNINGTANVSSSSWNVHFENYQATQNSNVTPSTVPTISGTTTTELTYVVNLVEPGDTYEFTVEVVNGGSIDATVDIESKLGGNVISQENPLPDYIDYSIKDSNGDAVVEHRLNHGTREMVTVRVAYKTDINPEDLPGTDETLVFEIELPAEQAPKEVNPYQLTQGVYIGDNIVSLSSDEVLPFEMETFEDLVSAKAQWSEYLDSLDYYNLQPTYLKFVLDQNRYIKESYIEFEITSSLAAMDDNMTPGTYELRGGVYEADLPLTSKTVYNRNKMFMNRAFGTENCEESICEYYPDCPNHYSYECGSGSSETMLHADDGGWIRVGMNGDWPQCDVSLSVDGNDVISVYCQL